MQTLTSRHLAPGRPGWQEITVGSRSSGRIRRAAGELLQARRLVAELTRRALSDRYRASQLGMAWTFVTPLLLLLVYTLVFGSILNTRSTFGLSASPWEFGIVLFGSLIPFNFFAESVGGAPTLIVGNVSYVKRVVFPLQALPVVSLLAGLVQAAIGLGLLAAGTLWITGRIPLTAVALPLVWAPLVLFTLATVYALAALGVFLRDLGQVIGPIISALFFLTPVLYPASAMPEAIRPFYWLNPLGAVVEGSRRTVVLGVWPEWHLLGAWTVGGALLLALGFALFVRLRPAFNDVL